MPTPIPMPTATTIATPSTSSSSSRWCPAPEQLMILELYRTGKRTPNASQIQKITAHPLSYGKIEGKNVFYWFQNRKARDRQRIRRKLIKKLQLGQHQSTNHAPPPPSSLMLPLQIFNHQHGSINSCYELSPPSHSSQPGCVVPSIQEGTATSPRSVVSNKWQAKGSIDCMLAMDVSPSCLHYLPRPMKTLDLFPTTSSRNLREDCNLNLRSRHHIGLIN